MKSEKGFALIETLVALALMGITAVGLLSGLSTTFRAGMISQERVVAESLAKSQWEYIKAQDYILTADYNPDDPDKRYGLIDIPDDLVVKGYTIEINAPEPIISPPLPSGSSLTSYTTEDSWVESNNPDTNKGSDSTIHIRVKYNAKKDVYELRRLYLKFNIPSLPPDQYVTSTKLKLYAKKADKPGVIGVYTVSTSWSEGAITWNNAPTYLTFITSRYVNSAGWWEFDITDAVIGGSTLSLVMKFTDETIYEQHVDCYSKEEGGGFYSPYGEIVVGDTDTDGNFELQSITVLIKRNSKQLLTMSDYRVGRLN